MQHRLSPQCPACRAGGVAFLLQALAVAGIGGCGDGRPSHESAAGGTSSGDPVAAAGSGDSTGSGEGGAPSAGSGGGGGTQSEGMQPGIGQVGGERDSGVSSTPDAPDEPSAPRVVSWETRQLSALHTAEGADAGDIDGDGVIDLVAGPTWYKGPDFAAGGTVIPNPPSFSRDQYSLFFLTFVDDVDGDGRLDVIAIGDAGGANGSGTPNAHWYRNPGPDSLDQAWVRTPMFAGLVANESPAFADVTGDGRRELVFMSSNAIGHSIPPAGASTSASFRPISSGVSFANYTHGLGVGDVDGDGSADILERTGWWRQVPAGSWQRQPFEFWVGSTQGSANDSRASNWGGAQMHVFDVDGDGDNDVVSGLAAHQYGLAWFERADLGAGPTFVPHAILPAAAGEGNISQLHALAVADINGDGLTDLVAGKRYYAHPSNNPDPGTSDPAILSWFELSRGESGADFTQHVIHTDGGAGCNFVVRDLNGDGKVDVFTTNKRGTFLHLQR